MVHQGIRKVEATFWENTTLLRTNKNFQKKVEIEKCNDTITGGKEGGNPFLSLPT